MVRVFTVVFILFLSGCFLGNDKFIRKKIATDDILVNWYYYSYITNASPEFIVAEKDGKQKEIYKASGVITNITIDKKKNIIIKLFQPKNGIVYTKKTDSIVFGYKIILDSSATYEEFMNTARAVKE